MTRADAGPTDLVSHDGTAPRAVFPAQQDLRAVSSIDASPAMLAVARRRLGDTASLQVGDATGLPYPDQAFDLALASTVLHEMTPAARAAALARSSGSCLLRAEDAVDDALTGISSFLVSPWHQAS